MSENEAPFFWLTVYNFVRRWPTRRVDLELLTALQAATGHPRGPDDTRLAETIEEIAKMLGGEG